MTIDSHCHLSAQDYDLPLNEIIQSAVENGVGKILGVACEAKDWPEWVATSFPLPSIPSSSWMVFSWLLR